MKKNKKSAYKERSLLPRDDNYGLNQHIKKLHWVKQIHHQLNKGLAQNLHHRYLKIKDGDGLVSEIFSNRLSYKYLELINIFRDSLLEIVDFDKKLDEAIKREDVDAAQQLANTIESKIISWFDRMLEWCAEHDEWALKYASRITAATTIGGFMQHIKETHRGDRPIEMTREQQVEELEKVKDAKSVGEIFRKIKKSD